MKVLDAERVASAAGREGFPSGGRPEVAFLGRSNVGKSSLLNRLVRRKSLAHTSGTPGKTRLVHFYQVRGPKRELLLVDLPGYGYARVSKAERHGWKPMVEGYLEDRAALRGAVLLQDVRRDVSEDETLLLAWLAERRVPAVVAITKADKLPQGQRAQRVRLLRAQLELPPEQVVVTSAQKGLGIPELWRTIDAWAGAGG